MSALSSKPEALDLAGLALKFLSVLKCPVCSETVMPPIFLCTNGHHLCSTCRGKITKCPLCKAAISNIRSLAMEEVAETLPCPCKYSEYGCLAQPPFMETFRHEQTCAFRAYPCVYKAEYSCEWTGLPTRMIEHIRSEHPEESIQCGEKVKHIFKDKPTTRCNEQRAVQSSFGQVFFLVFSGSPITTQFYSGCLHRLLVQFVGLPEEAKKFSLQLEIRGNTQTFTWTCTPNSVLESVRNTINRGNCVVFYAKNLMCDSNLIVYVTVQRQ